MRVYLIKKFAESINGIDLHSCSVGDLLDLEPFQAELLIAEGWATPARTHHTRGSHSSRAVSPSSYTQSLAADRRRRSAASKRPRRQ